MSSYSLGHRGVSFGRDGRSQGGIAGRDGSDSCRTQRYRVVCTPLDRQQVVKSGPDNMLELLCVVYVTEWLGLFS